jgi:hypothetical protein
MHHALTCLACAGLVLAAAPRSLTLADSTAPHPGTVEIVVDGTSRQQYIHKGRTYIEALEGKEYAIRLRNPYGVRVAVALSVDGLNTIDARQTTAAAARKWVLGPYETVTISGWQTSRSDARRFEFTTESRSYGAALGKTANLGIISAAFFKERVRQDVAIADGRQAPTPSAPASEASGAARNKASDELAATGMGRRMDHAVTQVWLDLEKTPAQRVNVRYEFRPQLVALGILPSRHALDPLTRRERAQGFEPGFSPVPPQR